MRVIGTANTNSTGNQIMINRRDRSYDFNIPEIVFSRFSEIRRNKGESYNDAGGGSKLIICLQILVLWFKKIRKRMRSTESERFIKYETAKTTYLQDTSSNSTLQLMHTVWNIPKTSSTPATSTQVELIVWE